MLFVRVDVQDKDGLTVPRSHNLVELSVTGPAEIVATDNGDATSHRLFSSHEREVYNGLCLVILKASPGKKGEVVLKAVSKGLSSAQVKLKVVD